jgi:glycosyltransferase involved in cell wall biosynthesis
MKKGLEHDLVLTWSRPPKQFLAEFADEIEKKRIVFLKNVPDVLLGRLYAGATLSWFPSKYEGFGLPILESMACGTPVVTCRNSALPEVGGEAVLYVEQDDIDSMADIMKLYDTGTGTGYEELRIKGIEQASKFKWDETASRYAKWYHAHC